MKKTTYFLILVLLAAVVSGCAQKNTLTGDAAGTKLIMFKSPNCGCCGQHAKYLEQNGFDVEIVPTPDMQSIKKQHNIPSAMQSCHTLVVGDYFIEGHVPVEAIEKLLNEKPAIDGIALPRMPSGSPGMPSAKRGPFEIYSLNNGEIGPFIKI